MSLEFEFNKLKKVSQDTLYSSIDSKLELRDSQIYMPCFSKYVKFHNPYSKKMFNLKNDYTLLEITDVEEKTKNRLQGKLKVKVIKTDLYIKAKDYNDYKNFVVEKEIFIKSNPIVDVLKFMEGCYDFNNLMPSIQSFMTLKKINNHHNNAYIEVMGCYMVSKISKQNYATIFPEYYGCFSGISDSYEHDISEDYNFINSDDWFLERNGNEFEIIYDNSLADFDKLSLDNLEKLNLKKMKGGSKDEDAMDVNSDDVLDLEIDIEEIYKQKEKSINIKKKNFR